MNKKILFLAVVIIVIVVFLILLWFLKTYNADKVIYWMSGYVAEANGGSLVVSGIARSSEPGEIYLKERTIEFQFTPKTVLKKTTTSISRSSKKFFSEITQGSASDLSKNMKIFKIESNDNLFTNDKAATLYVNYEVIKITD